MGGDIPASLNHHVQLRLENASVTSALQEVSKTCGLPISLDERATVQIKDKHLTLDTFDMTGSALLRNIALLFDLRYKLGDGKIVASLNEDEEQNAGAKIGNLPCLESWKNKTTAIHPDWNALFAQEPLTKKGLPFGSFSPELQQAIRSYCEEREASEILKTWILSADPVVSATQNRIYWTLFFAEQQRNEIPLTEQLPTDDEFRDRQFEEAYRAKYYALYRPFAVHVGNKDSESVYQLSLKINSEPPAEAPKAP